MYDCVCVLVSMLCTSVRRLLAVGQNLPRLRLLIITIKHNDYSFSSFHFASESGRVGESERESECECECDGQCSMIERERMPCNCCSAQSSS